MAWFWREAAFAQLAQTTGLWMRAQPHHRDRLKRLAAASNEVTMSVIRATDEVL